MNFTHTSNDILLEIKNLNIVFDVPTYPIRTLRDSFVNFVRNPIENIITKPDRLHLIKDFNLTLKKGERLGLLGINGTGKTSICRFIAGMHGDVPNIVKHGEVRAIFNTEAGIVPELSGRENAFLLTRLMYPTLKKHQLLDIIDVAIEFSELGDFVDTPFLHYSKGMKARLFLSIMSTAPSDILILDEVFDGADTFFSKKITQRVMRMIENSGAVIFVSHSFEELRKACTRLIVIDDHQIAFDGDVNEGIEFYLNHCDKPSPLKI